MSKKTDTLPSLLSFERKLETSDALMYAGDWSDTKNDKSAWQPIPITKRQNRSTQSAYGIDDAKKTEPNPVSSDSEDANLPHDTDTLKVSFTLRVIGNLGKPFACNDPYFETAISEKVNAFKGEAGEGLGELALRYAYNLANGRFLWRNRVGAEKVNISVCDEKSDPESEPLKFNAYDFSLKDFDQNRENEDLKKLAGCIQKGLGSDGDFTFFKVDAYVKLGSGQHIFPSQEMNMREKKKVLFKLGECAAVHNVKIGNALRTIDNWYDDAEFPIAAEPYGSVTQRGEAYRKSINDLYSLMQNWVYEKENKRLNDNDKNYVLANLIRGGVFSGEKKSKNSK